MNRIALTFALVIGMISTATAQNELRKAFKNARSNVQNRIEARRDDGRLVNRGQKDAVKQNVVKPFNGQNLDNWEAAESDWKNVWTVGVPSVDPDNENGIVVKEAGKGDIPCMINATPADWRKEPRQGVDLRTKEKFGDCKLSIEFFLVKGSNSGVYLMGEYEVQVNDSFGKADDKMRQGDMGALYSAAAPKTNATAEMGTWQKYEIDFVAPKFDADGNKTANAMFKKVMLNGKVVQENIEVTGSTGGGVTGKEAATGPLMLQGNHGPVAFRNIQIIPQ